LVSDEYNTFIIDDGEKLKRIHLWNDKITIEEDYPLPKKYYFNYKERLTNCPNYCPGEGGGVLIYSIFIKQANDFRYKTNWCCP